MKTYYAPTFIDNSISFRGKPTGRLSGFVLTRSFYRTGAGKIKATRGVVPFAWSEDTDEAKANALQIAIRGLEEMAELDGNPPLHAIPARLNKIEL
jgi:hypothetical protein